MLKKTKIYQYINKLKKEDIKNFALKQNFELKSYELDLIYYYIKNKYIDFFNNPSKVLEEISNKVRPITYNKINELYNKFKIYL